MNDLIDKSAGHLGRLSSPDIGSDNRTISLLTVSTTHEVPLSDELLTEVKELHRASRADNSKRSYATAWAQFSAWCAERGRCPLPPRSGVVRRSVADIEGFDNREPPRRCRQRASRR